jgi:hypothetical protein
VRPFGLPVISKGGRNGQTNVPPSPRLAGDTLPPSPIIGTKSCGSISFPGSMKWTLGSAAMLVSTWGAATVGLAAWSEGLNPHQAVAEAIEWLEGKAMSK